MKLTREQAAVAAMAVGYSLIEAREFPEELDELLTQLAQFVVKNIYSERREVTIQLLKDTFVELATQALSEEQL